MSETFCPDCKAGEDPMCRHQGLFLLFVLGAWLGFPQAFAQQTVPVPANPLELANGATQVLTTPEDRSPIIGLLMLATQRRAARA